MKLTQIRIDNNMGTFVTGRSYPTPDVDFTPQYDAFGRTTRHTTLNGSSQGVDFGYPDFDNNGNIESQTYYHRSGTPENTFGYDDLKRLTSAAYQAGNSRTEAFNYDLLGNRDSTTDSRSGGVNFSYASNNVNQYTSITPGSYTPLYDYAGNMTQDKSGYKYIYDYENRLTQITRQNNVVVAAFEYDALGRRIEKKDMLTGIAKRYYYDDQRIALQTSVSSGGSETDEKYFVYGNYIDEALLMHNLTGTYTGDFYYGHDHLYSPAVLFDSTGTPVERYEYDVYGTCRILAPDYSLLTSSQYGNPYTFTGRELDSVDGNALKVMYYRARSYDSQTGRFLQRDPLGINPTGDSHNLYSPLRQYKDGLNIYQYCRSNPLLDADPLGLTSIELYTNTYFPWHKGFIIDGKDIDFGPDEQKGGYAGKVPYGGYNASYSTRVKLRLHSYGWLKYGPKTGKSCCSSTLKNASLCLKYFAFTWDPSPYMVIGRNCWNFVYTGMDGCCLHEETAIEKQMDMFLLKARGSVPRER
jgi:RHS repeat-associated protein